MILAKTTLILDGEQSEQLRRLFGEIPNDVGKSVVLAQPCIVIGSEFADPVTVSVVVFNASATKGLKEAVINAIQAPLDPSDMLPPDAEKGCAK